MDIQLLLGLILYLFFSEFGLKAIRYQGMSYVMSEGGRETMFFAVEHIFIMVVAVVFAHLGSILARKAPEFEGEVQTGGDLFHPVFADITGWHPLVETAVLLTRNHLVEGK